MSELPDPLVPAEVDITDFQYMELDVQKLRDSKFAAEVDAEAFRAGVLLWCASWHQVPAGSLPNNDKELSALAGFGRVVKEWLKYREEALSLFTLCSDGRLYHRVIAEKAVSAWNSKLRHHYDRARDRLRKANKSREAAKLPPLPEFTFDQWNAARISKAAPMEKAEAADGIPSLPPAGSAGIPPENALKGNGEGTEKERNGEGEGDLKGSVPNGTDAGASSASSQPPSPPPPAPAPPAVLAIETAEKRKARLWRAGKSLLNHGENGLPMEQCGTFIGSLARKFSEAITLDVIEAAVLERPADAPAWMTAACQSRKATQLVEATQTNAEAVAADAAKLLGFAAAAATKTEPLETLERV